MKKRIFIFLSLIICFALASCSGPQVDNSWWSDDPNTELANELGLNQFGRIATELKGTAINAATVDINANEYAQVFTNDDVKSSLFATITDLDTLFEEQGGRAQNLIISALTFREIRSDDQNQIIKACFDEKYGVKTLDLGFDVNCASWTESCDLSKAYEAYEAGERNNCLAVIYLPVYLYHIKDNNKYTTCYAMVPIYYEITTYNGSAISSDAFNGIKVVELELDGGYLPGNSTNAE